MVTLSAHHCSPDRCPHHRDNVPFFTVVLALGLRQPSAGTVLGSRSKRMRKWFSTYLSGTPSLIVGRWRYLLRRTGGASPPTKSPGGGGGGSAGGCRARDRVIYVVQLPPQYLAAG